MKFYTKENNNELKIIKFGGSDTANKNLTVIEYKDTIMVIDCGIGLPDSEMFGVDVVIPDFSYLIENQKKIKGVFITHAHEDHFGAVPFLLDEINVPIYTTKLVYEFIKAKMGDRSSKTAEDINYVEIDENTKDLPVGEFTVSAFRVNHSVPSALGFMIKTPQGNIMHISDFKVDFAPVIDKPIDLGAIAKYSDEGILCLLSDCLGATTEGMTKSEQSLNDLFPNFFSKASDRQIMITTISSNISRMYQIIDAAIKFNRKVVPVGRSIEQSITIARKLNYLPFDPSAFLDIKKASKEIQSNLVYIIAGCYGQPGSSLDRVSRNEHNLLSLEENALVIFSADPNPPGVQLDVERVMNNLTINGAEVIYNKIQDNLHVSGHGAKGDLSIVASIAKPKYFIPIGGEPTKMRGYRNMIIELGFKGENVFEVLEGESVVFNNGKARFGRKQKLKNVYVDGTNNVGEVVMRDRGVLANDGVFIVVVPVDETTRKIRNNVEVITRGFVYVKESKQLINNSRNLINNILQKNNNKVNNWTQIQNIIEKEISKYLRKQTGREPMVVVHSIFV